MAKIREPAFVQVCSLKLATAVGSTIPGAPLDSSRLSLRCCLCLIQWSEAIDFTKAAPVWDLLHYKERLSTGPHS